MMDNWIEILILCVAFLISGLMASHFKKKRENARPSGTAEPESNREMSEK
jgi:hypothetical protein